MSINEVNMARRMGTPPFDHRGRFPEGSNMSEATGAGGRRDGFNHRNLAHSTVLQGGQGARVQPKTRGNDSAAGQGQHLRVEAGPSRLDSGRDSAGARYDEMIHFYLLAPH